MIQDKTNFEYSRKVVHLLSLLVPLGAHYSQKATQITLFALLVYYLVFEWYKNRGKWFLGRRIILKLQRQEELDTWSNAPTLLALGVLAAITLFSAEAAIIGIYQVGFCDTVAALAGKKWGRVTIPFMSRKTFVGTVAFFVAALPVGLYLLPPSKAIALALVGAFLESLPFKDWDNFTIPIVVAFLAEQFLF